LEVDLDGTFEFLLQKLIQRIPSLPKEDRAFIAFLAGFVDAEGTIAFHKKSHPGFEVQVTNTDSDLLRWIKAKLEDSGYHPRMYHRLQRAGRIASARESSIWRLYLYRRDEVRNLLVELPLRHGEKTTKAKLAVSFIDGFTALGAKGCPDGWGDYATLEKGRLKEFISKITEAILTKGNRGSR
jgi:hypothetical protein